MNKIDAEKLNIKANHIVYQINTHLNIKTICNDCFTVGDTNGSSNYYGAIDGRDRSGCCGACAKSNGYFPLSLVAYMEQKYDFDDKYGFLGEHSCNIPQEKRSKQCNSFLCKDIKNTNEYTSMLRMCAYVIEECNKLIVDGSNVDHQSLKTKEILIDTILQDGISYHQHIVYPL